MPDDDATGSTELSRRAFLKKMAAVGFAVPIVTSFALDGVAAATPDKIDHDHRFPNSTLANQSIPNQVTEALDEFLEQFFPNQTPF
jgi:hypothetical protein